ncbi:MAG: elongation factor G, partial [Terriglobales bacterium]
LPVIAVITRADHDHANVGAAVAGLRERFGRALCPVQLPLGEQRGFQGVIDLIAMSARYYQPGGSGKGRTAAIEDDDAARQAHEAMVELIAEGDDSLMEEFFEKGTIPLEHLTAGLRTAIRARRIVPVLVTGGLQNIGTDALLDFLAAYALHPGEAPARAGVVPGHAGEARLRPASDAEPLSVEVFKTIADPFAGRLSVFKVRSGKLKSDETLTNFRGEGTEKFAHLSVLEGKHLSPVSELHAGDWGAVAKLKDTLTGDTLGDKAAAIAYPAFVWPEAAIHFALEAKSRGDEDKVSLALHKMLEEDRALHFERDAQTQEFLLGGTGQQHVEIAVARLKHRYNVAVVLHAPRVAYRETILGKADVQGRHKKQTGGHGQFGDCWIRVEPLARGSGFEFVNEVFGGAIPKNYIPAVEKGIQESAARGYLAGYPMVDFRVVLYDGSYHDVDSSEMAFKIAGSLAFRKAMETARPVLLEPVMEVEVEAPEEFAGDLIGDLNARRGRIEGMLPRSGGEFIRAQVPLAEMLTYQSDLTAKTQGRGNFHMQFARYDLVPQAQADKIVAQARAAGGHTGEQEA